MKASDSFCPWWNSISDLFSSCHGVILDYEHSLTLIHCTVHGNVVIYSHCYIVLYMVMSSFIDPAPIVLYMVMSSFVDPATLYCPWLCRHSLTLLHCTVHDYVVIHSTCCYCTVHGNVVIRWPCYIVLSMVMSSFIDPATLYWPW
jgi:hypothetical protein